MKFQKKAQKNSRNLLAGGAISCLPTLVSLAVMTAVAPLPVMAQEAGEIDCGLNTGEAATGDPIRVGGINGNAPPGDFSGGTDGAAAYFKCLNANGGINGRPIRYIAENDQWDPELAGQVAAKLVKDQKVVAMVGNGSVVEMAVNAQLYVDEGIMSMAAGCPIAECFESANIVSTNQGPVPSGIGALTYAVEELDAKNAACIGLNIVNNGGWACDWIEQYMEDQGLEATSFLMDPTAIDLNSVYLQALAEGVDTILLMLPAGSAIGMLQVAEEQDGRDLFNWVAPTSIYDPGVAETLGDYWNDQLHVNIELAPYDSTGPDNVNWAAVTEQYGKKGDRLDTFSQAGYLSAKFFADALMELDPEEINRETVTEAIRGIVGVESDLLCAPYYVGEADMHVPNHAGRMVAFRDAAFHMVRECYDIETAWLDPVREHEKELGITE